MISASPALGTIGVALAFVSHNGVIKINVLADTAYMEHASELNKIIESTVNRIIDES